MRKEETAPSLLLTTLLHGQFQTFGLTYTPSHHFKRVVLLFCLYPSAGWPQERRGEIEGVSRRDSKREREEREREREKHSSPEIVGECHCPALWRTAQQAEDKKTVLLVVSLLGIPPQCQAKALDFWVDGCSSSTFLADGSHTTASPMDGYGSSLFQVNGSHTWQTATAPPLPGGWQRILRLPGASNNSSVPTGNRSSTTASSAP